ncbi:MAG: hypothetical protein RG740_02760 [Acholeplasmataceae bacterium]|nr:hypothetical protein [Acholeplasmataceae bacterium]
MIWEIIRSMNSVRGYISLFIAYMIYHGWALLFFLLGIASSNAWLIAIGSTVMLFWFGPGTPVVPLIIVTGMFIQRFILLDKSNQIKLRDKWKELVAKDKKKARDE